MTDVGLTRPTDLPAGRDAAPDPLTIETVLPYLGGNDRYVALCRKHFSAALAG